MKTFNALFSSIDDPAIRGAIEALYAIFENIAATNRAQQAQIQRLRNELSRLKGEQGKPDVKPINRSSNSSDSDHSSEADGQKNRPKEPRHKDTKKDKIKIDRTQDYLVNKSILPADAVASGYEYATVQDLKIETDNVAFKKEI